MRRWRLTYRSLAVIGLVCALVGVVLLTGFDDPESATRTAPDLLGSLFVGAAVMSLATVALLRAGRR